MRKKIGLPGDSQFFLTIGRNAAQKNLVLGLTAFARWKTRPKNLCYVIVGKGAHLLDAEAQKLRIKDSVRLVERLVGDDLVAAYQAAVAFVLPSRWEFCPLVILEAMAAGLPQAATRVQGNTDYVVEGKTGLLTNDNDPDDLANVMAKLASNNELRNELSENSRQHAGGYDWTIIADRYIALFSPQLSSP
ncbi:MAG: glycosyltransferase family 4 protein [Limisphaerales bacterium]